MLVFMEPYVNVPPKGCALLLRAMDRIEASGQPCIAQQLVLPHVEAFSSTLLLRISSCISRIIVSPSSLSSSSLSLLWWRLFVGLLHARLAVELLRARLGVGSGCRTTAPCLDGIQVIHLPVLTARAEANVHVSYVHLKD